MTIRIISDILIAIGVIFAAAGTKGVLKMPDLFSRMQASTCISTLGVAGVCLGALVYTIFGLHNPADAVKILVIMLMVFVTNPVGSHAIFKGAYRAGYRPDKEMEIDAFRRDFDE